MTIMPIYDKKDLIYFISVFHEWLHLEITKTNKIARLAKLFETTVFRNAYRDVLFFG